MIDYVHSYAVPSFYSSSSYEFFSLSLWSLLFHMLICHPLIRLCCKLLIGIVDYKETELSQVNSLHLATQRQSFTTDSGAIVFI